MTRIMAAVVITLSVAITTAGGSRSVNPVSFPSNRTETASADGRFAVVNVDSDFEPHHALFLENRKTRVRRKLVEYGRSVEVLWNPNGNAFAVTDYVGSNISECFVYSTSADEAPVNVADEIQHSIANPIELASIQKNDHIYYAAVRWTSPQTLRVKVWGHGDVNPSGFIRTYTYRMQRKR